MDIPPRAEARAAPAESPFKGKTGVERIARAFLNSSVEAAIDRISLDRHSLSKRAKDLGSAAVLVALLLLAAVWGLVLLPRAFA